MALRILHLADLHLGWIPAFLKNGGGFGDGAAAISTGGAPPYQDVVAARQEERDSVLERAVDWALDPANRIDLVVLAGDLFERHDPPAALVRRVMGALERLARQGIPVVTVPGNHDELTYPDSVYRTYADRWPGVLVQQPEPVALPVVTTRDGEQVIHVYSMAYIGGITPAWPPMEHFPPAATTGDDAAASAGGRTAWHVAVFHGTLMESLPAAMAGRLPDRSLPLRMDALAAAGYDYVALGHLHRHAVFTRGRTTAVYPGAPAGKGFDDPGVGFFVVAQLDRDGGVRLVHQPCGCRPMRVLEVDVTGVATAEALAQHLLHRLRETGDIRALVRVFLRGAPAFPVEPDALALALKDECFYVECHDATEGIAPAQLEALATEPTVRGLFVERLARLLREAPADDDAAGSRRVLRQALRWGLQALEAGRRGT